MNRGCVLLLMRKFGAETNLFSVKWTVRTCFFFGLWPNLSVLTFWPLTGVSLMRERVPTASKEYTLTGKKVQRKKERITKMLGGG